MAPTATSSSHRRARPARTDRRAFPARAIHLVDVENLTGAGLPTSWEVSLVRDVYAAQIGIGPLDHVVIGCNHLALPSAGYGWPGARYLVRSGPDGADTELLAVIAGENIPARFTHVTIASGDGAFSHAAAALAAAGCQVTIVSRPGALSRRLALAAQHVVYIDAPGAPGAPTAAGAAA